MQLLVHKHTRTLMYVHTLAHPPLQAVLKVDSGLEPINGKGYDAGKDGGSTVDQGDHDGLALKVVVVLVVAGKSYKWSKTQTQREKDLSGCIDPRIRVGKLLHLKDDINRICPDVEAGHARHVPVCWVLSDINLRLV